MKASSPVLILASASPRRAQLLSAAGIAFRQMPAGVEEVTVKGEAPRAMTLRLACDKAYALAERIEQGWILAADTTVVHPNGKKILGKPRTEVEAVAMLQSLQGKEHQVITGYALLQLKSGKTLRKVKRAVSTRVLMRKLSLADIRQYVASGECMDKAGAYAAQGVGMTLIEKIRGSYTNVVGLPVAELLKDLARVGF